MQNHTVPLYTKTEDRIKLHGSAVFVLINGVLALLTARHVMDTKQPLYLPADTKIKGVDAKMHFPVVRGKKIDLSVVYLKEPHPQELAQQFEPWSFSADSVAAPVVGNRCIVFGFPATRINRDYSKNRLTNIPLRIATQIESVDSKAPLKQFAVTFVRDHKTHRNRLAPDPHGMSGCGVWTDDEFKAEARKLIGLAIEYCGPRVQRILCVSVYDLLKLI